MHRPRLGQQLATVPALGSQAAYAELPPLEDIPLEEIAAGSGRNLLGKLLHGLRREFLQASNPRAGEMNCYRVCSSCFNT